jgi:hypothetical protein
MAFLIDEFRGQLTGGGARANLFECEITNPYGGDDQKFTFMAKASQLPGDTLGVIEVPYFGRTMKVPGNRTFAEWTVTVINDEDFNVRTGMEQWMTTINSHIANIGTPSPLLQKSVGTIKQFSKDGSTLKTYQFIGIFPADISPIDVAWDSNDTIEEFTVTFQYDYWTDVSNGVI